MSDTTTRLNLPLIAEAQAQKHVTHNEALSDLDTLVQLTVQDRDLNTPPASPAEGDAWIVAASATGEWAGHDGEIAAFRNGGWVFHAPQEGFRAWVADEDILLIHDGTAWQPFTSGAQTFLELADTPADFAGQAGRMVRVNAAEDALEFADAPQGGGTSLNPADGGKVGVNTTADNTNRLAVKSDAVLFSHDDVSGAGSGDIRAVLNKAFASNTASFLFQDNWSGRAEFGLTGDDNFHIKVSPDGTVWHEGIIMDRNTGKVHFPGALYAEAAVFNLMRDGGRFAGTPEPRRYQAYSFARPSWMATNNGASVSEHAKFIRDSSSYGGAQPAIDPDVKQLVDMIVDPDWRRYYTEFFVAAITAGSGTSSSLTFPDSIQRYTAIYTASFMRPVSITISYYIKVKSGDVGIPNYSTTTIYLDGVEQTGHFVVPGDGAWHHVLIIESGEFSQHYRYSYDAIRLCMRPGDVALMAFPSLVPGRLRLPVDVGQIPSTTGW